MRKRISPDLAGVLFAFVHMSMEIACYYWLFTRVRASDHWWLWAVSYNALAFLPQALWGALTDDHPELDICTPGLALVALAHALPWNLPALLLLTCGNCMVHVAGAQNTVRGADGRMGPSGVFVGGGSFGVISGQLLAAFLPGRGIWVTMGFLLAAAAASLFVRGTANRTLPASGYAHASALGTASVGLLAFATVAARSYVGYAIPTGWNTTVRQSVLLFCCMGLGKASGGYAADRFGARRTAVWSLLASLPFLLMGNDRMTLSLIGVSLFSMTMSVSLGILLSVFPESPGVSFGITTAGLFLGSLPIFFYAIPDMRAHILIVSVLTTVTIGCFLLCGRNAVNKKGE